MVRSDAPRDENRVTVLIGVSSSTGTVNGISYVTGVTPVPVAVDPTTHAIVIEAV